MSEGGVGEPVLAVTRVSGGEPQPASQFAGDGRRAEHVAVRCLERLDELTTWELPHLAVSGKLVQLGDDLVVESAWLVGDPARGPAAHVLGGEAGDVWHGGGYQVSDPPCGFVESGPEVNGQAGVRAYDQAGLGERSEAQPQVPAGGVAGGERAGRVPADLGR